MNSAAESARPTSR